MYYSSPALYNLEGCYCIAIFWQEKW
jgi:hypothetical protein